MRKASRRRSRKGKLRGSVMTDKFIETMRYEGRGIRREKRKDKMKWRNDK